ncbi:MAG TPA: molybdopterin dinucleotide binding domain-containing protein [Thermoleophilia bacterium]|nr:molybdopterin dinucleotide binding domain-containing protein [Thermoleophilia bacterium]
MLEFESSSLQRYAPDDPERQPILTYRESWEGPHAEGLFAKYPLQLISPHVRHSFHTHNDGKQGTLNEVANHRVLLGGHYHWIARIHPLDSIARGIADGDLVRLFNDRGGVICAAQVTERVRPGVVHPYESSAVYDPLGAPGLSDDRGGCVNVLTPSRMMIEKSHAMAANSRLIEVEPWRREA